MKPKTLITLSFAIGCGLVAALLMKQAGSSAPVVEESKLPVLVVVEPIGTGDRVTSTNVKFKDIAESLVPEGAITSADQYSERALKSPAEPGEILTVDRMGERGVYGPSILIEPGYRVVGVPVDASNSFSGMLDPGDIVDILVTYKVEYQLDGRQKLRQTKTATLLEAVKIFATDNRRADTGGDAGEDKSTNHVHLLLTPEQATYVKLAQEKGRLSLAWRSELDLEEANVGTIADALLDELNGAIGGVNGNDQPSYENAEAGSGPFDEDQLAARPPEAEQASEEPADFADFLNQTAEETAAAPKTNLWTMQVFNGTSSELHEVPLPEEPVREAPANETESEEAGANAEDANDQGSAIGTTATLLRQFLLGI